MVSFPDPHQPYKAREPYRSQFPESEIEIPSTFWQEDIPDWLDRHREADYFPMCEENRGPWSMDREKALREVKANYLAMIKHLDDCVGQLYAGLEQHGILDETVIVFTTDHGDLMGEHGLTQKEYLYEVPYRIPFIIRWPEKITSNETRDQFMTTQETSSLKIDQNDDSNRPYVFTHPFTFDRVACFSPDYLLGYDRDGEAVLFDRLRDPEQIHNLFADPAHQARIKTSTAAMRQHYQTYCPKALPWLGDRPITQL